MRANEALLVATLGLVGCAEAGPLAQPRAYPVQARIVCDEDGTTLETPTVTARRDGVHMIVMNETASNPGFTFLYDHAGGGNNAPPGISRHIETIPPGQARVGCWMGAGPGEIGEPDLKPLTVVDPEGFFTPMTLECASGQLVHGSGGALAAGTTSDRDELVEAVRAGWAYKLAQGDVVELAGYPTSPDETSVRVVRDGRVIARADYILDFERWGDDGYEACVDEF